MYVESFFHDTVASLRRSEEIRTSLVVVALLAGVQWTSGHDTAAPRSLRLTISSARNGTEFTLSCAMSPHMDLWTTKWYRNTVHIFDATDDDTLSPLTDSPDYQSVSGRISVNSSLQQHNVTVRTNSKLDQGSVWRCETGKQFSNNLTTEVKQSMQGTDTTEGASSLGPESTRDSTPLATEGQHTGLSSTDVKNMITTSQTTTSTQTPFIHTAEFIYVVAGAAGGVVIVVVIVIVVLLCIRTRREGKCQANDKTEKDNCKEGEHNKASERETIVMEDNELYHGFVRTENQESAEEEQVSNVYAKVNKVRKTHNATEVQITLSIEDMYAKPNKPASGKSEAASKVSSSQNADVNTPD